MHSIQVHQQCPYILYLVTIGFIVARRQHVAHAVDLVHTALYVENVDIGATVAEMSQYWRKVEDAVL